MWFYVFSDPSGEVLCGIDVVDDEHADAPFRGRNAAEQRLTLDRAEARQLTVRKLTREVPPGCCGLTRQVLSVIAGGDLAAGDY